MSQFVDQYKAIDKRREADEASYIHAFAALLGITILAAVGVGAFVGGQADQTPLREQQPTFLETRAIAPSSRGVVDMKFIPRSRPSPLRIH